MKKNSKFIKITTPLRLNMLAKIYEEEGIYGGGLIRKFGISPSATYTTLSVLEEENIIKVSRENRSKIESYPIFLTEKGRPIAKKAMELYKAMVGNFNEEENSTDKKTDNVQEFNKD